MRGWLDEVRAKFDSFGAANPSWLEWGATIMPETVRRVALEQEATSAEALKKAWIERRFSALEDEVISGAISQEDFQRMCEGVEGEWKSKVSTEEVTESRAN